MKKIAADKNYRIFKRAHEGSVSQMDYNEEIADIHQDVDNLTRINILHRLQLLEHEVFTKPKREAARKFDATP